MFENNFTSLIGLISAFPGFGLINALFGLWSNLSTCAKHRLDAILANLRLQFA